MKSIALNAQARIPVLGLGTWQLTGDDCVRGVEYALKNGYTHIDTADGYGNHRQVAQGIKDSGISRENFFITTKLAYPNGYTAAAVRADGERFLKELDTPYIDLLLIHWPNREVPFAETLKAMSELKSEGTIKAIGVSNFTPHHLEDALKAGVEITNNQVEVRPSFNQKALRDYCASKNISITAYSSLKGGETELPLIIELANKYGMSPAQVVLNWIVARGMIAIPKSTKPERITENLESLGFTIEEADLARIDSLPQGNRVNNPSFGDFDY
ncbi:MAG TPA: aldo/keto reductase [Candidatus Paceibacterota bacterium]|nr:aldo/keto reductase [Candidatus Paceibacterota bacterium]